MSTIAGEMEGWDGFSEVGTNADGSSARGDRFLSDMLASGGAEEKLKQFAGQAVEERGDVSEAESEFSLDGTKRMKPGYVPSAVAGAALELRAMGAEWSSAIRANTYAVLQRGKFAQAGPDRAPVDDQLIFKSPVVKVITELETAGGLYDQLKAGTVVASIVGATGIGKSTKFSGKIAVNVGCRVLQIAPDCISKDKHAREISKLVSVSPYWSKSKRPLVSFMTPEEFCGRFFGDGWREMIECFDVVVLDESHIPTAWVNGVKAAVTSKCKGSVSLLMLTATMPGVQDMQSVTQKPRFLPRRIEEIVGDDDFMESDFAVDRTMIIVESNERLQAVASLLGGVGCVVLTLESGASIDAVDRVEASLRGDSPAVRILIAHSKFGYASNLTVSRVLTTGLRQFVVSDGNGGYVRKCTPLSMAEVKQHLGRANRGLVTPSGQGVVLLEEQHLAPQVEIVDSEKFTFYVLLIAMGINPSKKLRATYESMLPHGLSRRVAVAVLGVFGLPAEVVIQFLGQDGAFPHSYSRSLRQFSTVGSNTIVSEFKVPVGFENWVEVDAFGILGKDFGPKIKVPFIAEGELMVLLTFVCAAAQGLYVPEAAPMLRDDGYTSGPERETRRVKKWAGVTYKPVPLEVVQVRQTEPRREVRRQGFVLDVPLDQQPSYRRSGSVSFSQHVRDELRLVEYSPKIEERTDDKGRAFIAFIDDLDVESPVEVASGRKVFKIPKPMWRQLQRGEIMNESGFNLLLSVLKRHFSEFAASSAFVNWGDPWITVLASFVEEDYVMKVKAKGLVPQVVSFLGLLWQRYVNGMKTAVEESHWSVGFWQKMVTRFRVGRGVVPRAEPDQPVEIAQTQNFKNRLYLIRLNFALCISSFEEQNIFAHEAVANVQRILPVSRALGNSVFDAVRDGNAVRPMRRRRVYGDGYDELTDSNRVVEVEDFDEAVPRLADRFNLARIT